MEPAKRIPAPTASLLRIRESHSLTHPGSTLWSLIEHTLAGLKPATRKAHGEDLASFAAWMEAPSTAAAAATLVAHAHGEANALAFEHRSGLLELPPNPENDLRVDSHELLQGEMMRQREDIPLLRGQSFSRLLVDEIRRKSFGRSVLGSHDYQ